MDAKLTWAPLTEGDLPALVELAGRCVAEDGGLPLAATAPFLARRFTGEAILSTAARLAAGTPQGDAAPGGGRPGAAAGGAVPGVPAGGIARAASGGGAVPGGAVPGVSAGAALLGGAGAGAVAGNILPGAAAGAGATDGGLVAAGSVREVGGAAVFTGLVSPAWRGAGLGASLLDWGLGAARTAADRVVVETESLTGAAERLFASRGLRCVFAEEVLRFDLVAEPPRVPVPGGAMLTEWTAALAERFFTVYEAAFRDRPGFPGWPARQWIEWISDDEDFRPDWTLLASDAEAGDVGFVACAEGWLVQVGVRPDWRGRGLGGALVTEALHRMRAAGAGTALLDVNVDNPAGALYRRLGFTSIGRRARFTP